MTGNWKRKNKENSRHTFAVTSQHVHRYSIGFSTSRVVEKKKHPLQFINPLSVNRGKRSVTRIEPRVRQTGKLTLLRVFYTHSITRQEEWGGGYVSKSNQAPEIRPTKPDWSHIKWKKKWSECMRMRIHTLLLTLMMLYTFLETTYPRQVGGKVFF